MAKPTSLAAEPAICIDLLTIELFGAGCLSLTPLGQFLARLSRLLCNRKGD